MDDEIDLKELLSVLWRRKIMILLVFLISVVGAIIYSFNATPTYQIVGEFALGNFSDKTYTNQSAAKEILLSDELLLNVIQQLNMPKSRYGDLNTFKTQIKVDPIKDTNFLKISLITSDKIEGINIIEKMIQIFTEQGNQYYLANKNLLSSNLNTLQVSLNTTEKDIELTRAALISIEKAEAISNIEKDINSFKVLNYLNNMESQRIDLIDKIFGLQKDINNLKNVEILKKPCEPERPVSPKKRQNTMVAGIIGLMIGIAGAFILEYFNKNRLNLQR